MSGSDLENTVYDLLKLNRRNTDGHTYTVPSPKRYPFQWLWDSCFHAIILQSCGDIKTAKEELSSVCSRPMPSGLLPHIIYWEDAAKFPEWGREDKGCEIDVMWGTKGHSSITQPPIIATTVLRIFEADPDQEFLTTLYPTLKGYYDHLIEDRRFNGDALVYIINPDESGEDNSPRFDSVLDIAPQHTELEHLDKRMQLMRANADCDFKGKTCMSNHFGVADVPFNILFAEGLRAMAVIATTVGESKHVAHYEHQARAVEQELRKLIHHDVIFAAHDVISNKFITTKTWALFMPLYGKLLSQKEAEQLVNDYLLNEEHFKTPYGIPTTALSEPSFDADDGFWRGPVWMVPNWYVYHGLKNYGYHEEAAALKEQSLALLEKSGFREQYNPITGEGLGAENFTWGGLVLDMN